jgi:hypothetical protein
VRTETSRHLTVLRGELLRLADERERHLRSLGLAVYEGDDESVNRLQGELRSLDEERRAKEEQMRVIAERAEARTSRRGGCA